MKTEALECLLLTLAVRVHAFSVCEIQSGWRLSFDPEEGITVHYVLVGAGTLQLAGAVPVRFGSQHLIVVPPGVPHSVSEGGDHIVGEARAADNCSKLENGLVQLTAGGASRDMLIICGTVSANYAGALGLFDLLREPIVADLSSNATMRMTLEIMLAEMTSPSLGTRAMIEALMKQCLILLLRQHLTRAEKHSPFFLALQDSRLAAAITHVIEHPSAPHTVGSLAALANMSRSAFAERFSNVLGHTPMHFVQNVRLRLAAHLLKTTDLPINMIATKVGYASRSYFSKAFRVMYGTDPKMFRTFGGYEEAGLTD
jgi:AraC-like DNA-binding protein